MPIRLPCSCGKTLQVPRKLLGRSVTCPACGRELIASEGEEGTSRSSPDDFWNDMLPPASTARPASPTAYSLQSTASQRAALRLAWLTPVTACIAFVVLIAGGLAIRQVIVVLRQIGNDPKAAIAQTGAPDPPTVEVQSLQDATRSKVKAESVDRPSTDEPTEVLPAPVAKKPRPPAPCILVVGEGPNDFVALEEALKFAQSGDVIEIRTNRPMVARMARYFGPEDGTVDRLTIRAGTGYQPVLRNGWQGPPRVGPSILTLYNVNATVHGLHFASGGMEFQHSLILGGSTHAWGLSISECTFTCWDGVGAAVTIDEFSTYCPVTVRIDRCVSRGAWQGLAHARPPRIDLAAGCRLEVGIDANIRSDPIPLVALAGMVNEMAGPPLS